MNCLEITVYRESNIVLKRANYCLEQSCTKVNILPNKIDEMQNYYSIIFTHLLDAYAVNLITRNFVVIVTSQNDIWQVRGQFIYSDV